MRQTVITILALSAMRPSRRPARSPSLSGFARPCAPRRDAAHRPVPAGREEQTDRQTRTLKVGTDGELTLGNISGDIVVTRGNGAEATIEIVKTARARTVEEAREFLGLVTVNVTERSGRAEVKPVYPPGDDRRRNNRRNVNVSVAYTVSTPAGTRLTIGSISGSINVSGIKGDLSANSISGSVHVANAGRIAAAKSISAMSRSSTRRPTARWMCRASAAPSQSGRSRHAVSTSEASAGRSSSRTPAAIASRRTRSAATSSSGEPSPRAAATS